MVAVAVPALETVGVALLPSVRTFIWYVAETRSFASTAPAAGRGDTAMGPVAVSLRAPGAVEVESVEVEFVLAAQVELELSVAPFSVPFLVFVYTSWPSAS